MANQDQKSIDLKIGTSGYSYDDWRGVFYPQKIPSNKMLEFYCQHFNTVEINMTYYALPRSQIFEGFAKRTPENFKFIVKTNKETTHVRKENDTILKKLLESMRPLFDSGKFSGFLAQFPYSFKNTEKNREYLADTKKLIGDLPLFVEFRNYTWNDENLAKFLNENDIGYVNVDEPRLRGLLPPQDIATTNMGYIRMHGRNGKNWWDGTNTTRYDYGYSNDELKEWLTNISNILKKTYKTYIFFNNHPTGKAVKNARQMMEILKDKI